MTASNYSACLRVMLAFEGGYADHPRDPGGATNMGITHRTLAAWRGKAVTKDDVRALTAKEAGQIYRARYWNEVRGDDLPDGFDLVAFDGGVNSGPKRGIQWLQKGLLVKADGGMGPVTLKAASVAADGVQVIQRACAARMGFLQRLGTWDVFGRGWGRRVATVEAEAVGMYTRDASRVEVEGQKAGKQAAARTREAAYSGSAGGGAGVTRESVDALAGASDALFYGAVAVALLVAVVLVVKAAKHRRRKEAYEIKAKEMAK